MGAHTAVRTAPVLHLLDVPFGFVMLGVPLTLGFTDTRTREARAHHRTRRMADLARAGLQKHNNGVGDFFTARHIDGWQYPIAETLCAWMIRQNRRGPWFMPAFGAIGQGL